MKLRSVTLNPAESLAHMRVEDANGYRLTTPLPLASLTPEQQAAWAQAIDDLTDQLLAGETAVRLTIERDTDQLERTTQTEDIEQPIYDPETGDPTGETETVQVQTPLTIRHKQFRVTALARATSGERSIPITVTEPNRQFLDALWTQLEGS